MDNKFNFKQIWRAYSNTGNETVTLAEFNNIISFAIFAKGSKSSTPLVRCSLNGPIRFAFLDHIKAIMAAEPMKRLAINVNTYNSETRTSSISSNWVFSKDEKNAITLEVTDAATTVTYSFPIRCSASFSTGAEPLSDADRSTYAMRDLLEIYTKLPDIKNLSRFNWEPYNKNRPNNRQGGGRPGGQGGYGNNNGGYNRGSEGENFM